MNLPFVRGLSRVPALFLLGSVARLAAAEPVAPARPADIPLESFFRPAAVRFAQLNPAGTHLAVLNHDPKADAYSLVIISLADQQVKGLRGTTELNPSRFLWAGDERLVLSAIRNNIYAGGLYTINRNDPSKITTLYPNDAVEVLGTPRQRTDNLLVWVRRSARSAGRDIGVEEVDLRFKATHFQSDDLTRMVRSSLPVPRGYTGVHRWLRDREGEIRYALVHRDGRTSCLRRDAGDEWTEVPINLDVDRPLSVEADPAVLLVAHGNPDGACELARFDTRNASLGPVLYRDEKYDFAQGSVRYSSTEKDVIGLSYARQTLEQVWLREDEADLQRSIDAVLPGRVNQIVSRSKDGRRLLLISSSDRHPGTLYFLDRDAWKLRNMVELAPWLPERLMAPVRTMTFKARDGLKLDGYVTVPPDHDPTRPAPMVVLPHGGPWMRDSWGYDPESQFFASRGYIVFRPNYRGSTGYNPAVSIQPRLEFRKMHEDVTDGVRALIAAKIADPAHIAIIGASFGGYLSICGAAFEPDLYRCAVSIAGVFDWERVMKEDRGNEVNISRAEWLKRDLGDPKVQREKFEAMSPFYSVARIKIPVFIAHGEEDENADTSQSRRLVKALKAAGVKNETCFIPEESHGLAEMKHRVELYRRIDAFLKRNL